MFNLFKRRAHAGGLPTGGIQIWTQSGRRANFERGFPEPLGPAEQRNVFTHVIPGGALPNLRFRPYDDRGAAAYAYQFGVIETNPIGGNVVPVGPPATQPFSYATRQVSNGVEAIFWGPPPPVNGGLNPQLGPLYTPETLATLLGKQIMGGGK